MKKYRNFLVFIMVLMTIFSLGEVKVKAAPSDLIYLLEVKGEINPGLYKFIQKGIDKAEREGANAIIVEINTYGGLVDSAIKIRDELLNTPLLTIAYVNDRAWSAGALITLACDRIYMSSGSSIGAAETRPHEEKYNSALRKEFKATAEEQGRNPDIAAAMVDVDIQIPDVIEKGKLLTLTGREAVRLKMADQLVTHTEEILEEIELSAGVIRVIEPSLIDHFTRLVSNPYLSTILITVGLMGLIIEAFTLGWGIAGSIGLLSLALFYSGNLLVGNTSWGLILLFIAGVVLMGLEVFVVPGFGITGIGGILLMFASIFLTFNNPIVGMYALSFAIVLSLATIILVFKYLDQSKLWNRIALNTSQTLENGYRAPSSREELIGEVGEALSILRPAGTALIHGERVDVISEGGYINKGRKIKVVKIEGTKVIVREL